MKTIKDLKIFPEEAETIFASKCFFSNGTNELVKNSILNNVFIFIHIQEIINTTQSSLQVVCKFNRKNESE